MRLLCTKLPSDAERQVCWSYCKQVLWFLDYLSVDMMESLKTVGVFLPTPHIMLKMKALFVLNK